MLYNADGLPLLNDNQLAGGFQVVADETARNAIPIAKRKKGMFVSWISSGLVLSKKFIGATTADVNWTNNTNWATFTATKGRYSVSVSSDKFNPVNGSTIYFGINTQTITTDAVSERFFISVLSTLAFGNVEWYAYGTAGSGENISVYIRRSNTQDYLLATIGNTNALKNFRNTTSFAASCAIDSYLVGKIVCPTWATPPTQVRLTGVIMIENA